MNDKQKARWEEVREEIAKGEYSRHKSVIWPDWNKLGAEYIKDQYRKYAEGTLNLKDSKGYLIEIADPDQSKPNNPIHPKTQADLRRFDCYNLAQVDMDDWIKIIPKE